MVRPAVEGVSFHPVMAEQMGSDVGVDQTSSARLDQEMAAVQEIVASHPTIAGIIMMFSCPLQEYPGCSRLKVF